jgi:hypothetical protein
MMSPADLLAQARRQRTPADLDRFLDQACGSDAALRAEVLRQLAQVDAESKVSSGTANYESRSGEDGSPVFDRQGDPESEIDVAIGEVMAERYRVRE